MATTEASYRDRLQLLAVGVGWLLLLIGIISALPWSPTDWQTALTLIGIVGLISYGLHRYERVRLGLVREDEP